MDNFKSYIKAINEKCEAEDAIFNGSLFKNNTPQFSIVIRSQYGNGFDFKHEIFEYRGSNCYLPTKAYCFVKCIIFITGENCKQQYLSFNSKERK